MSKLTLILMTAVVAVAATLVACGDDGDSSTPSATGSPSAEVRSPTAEPTARESSPTSGVPTSPPGPSDTPIPAPSPAPTSGGSDGISAQQAVIDAARAGDIDTLRSFVRATGVACVTVVEGIGGPPQCRDGESEGTVVQVVQVADCEGHLDRIAELQLPLYEGGVPFVNAYAAPPGFAIEGETILVFQTSSPGIPEQGIAIVMDGGAITGFYNGCGQTVAQLVEALGLGEPIAVDPGS